MQVPLPLEEKVYVYIASAISTTDIDVLPDIVGYKWGCLIIIKSSWIKDWCGFSIGTSVAEMIVL